MISMGLRVNTFLELGLTAHLCQCLGSLGFDEPTEIQKKTIPQILASRDIIAGAHTGSGKTLAYLLPILDVTICHAAQPQVLIVTPTRELAQQVYKVFERININSDLKAVCVYGGVSINVQKQQIEKGVDIIIGTTGRVLDLIHLKSLDISCLRFWVLDEGDRLLDMGFLPDIERLSGKMQKKPQTLLFSATYSDQVIRFSQQFLQQPQRIQVNVENSIVSTVEQRLYELDERQKASALSYLIGSENWQQVLVFVKKKVTSDAIAKELKLDGIKAISIHGDKSQGARMRALESFSTGKFRVLVATDVVARGLHIDDLKVVINYDVPFKPEDYVHRIGRTGRLNKTGLAVTFVTKKDNYMLKEIEHLTEQIFVTQKLIGFEPKH